MMLKVATVWILMGAITEKILHAAGYEIDSGICGIRKVSPDIGRIVAGSMSEPGSWPWQAMMQSNGISICGAVLISEEYLVTAAHCVLSGKKDLSFHLGAHRADASDDTAVEVQVHVMLCHPDFEWDNFSYDLCVVKLATPTNFTDFIQPVCLPDEGSRIAVGERVAITGWGRTLNTGSNDYLNEAEVLILETNTCKSWYASLEMMIPDSHFCAGYQNGRIDSCEGDSGGPLVHSEDSGNITAYVLRGITSFGYRCALQERPGVYVRVSKLTTWIEQKMKDLSDSVCQATASVVCGGNISSEAVIRSPTSAGTFDYPSDQECTWNVTAPVGFQIHFTFMCYFLLSPPEADCQDYVEIADSEGNQQRFCGNEIPSPYVVDGGISSFTFVTNHDLNYPGFIAKITFVKSNASNTVNTSMSSPVVTSHDSNENTIGINTTTIHAITSASDSSTFSAGFTADSGSSSPTYESISTKPLNPFYTTNDRTHTPSVTTKSDDSTPSTSETHNITGNAVHTNPTVIVTTSHATHLYTVNWTICALIISMMTVSF